MRLARFAALVTLGLVVVACRRDAPAKTPTLSSVELSPSYLAGAPGKTPPFLVESASAVVPPNPANPHCPRGRLFLAASDYNRGQPALVLASRGLDCLENSDCFYPVERSLPGGQSIDRRGSFFLQKNPAPGPDGRCLHQYAPGGFRELPVFPSNLAGTDQQLLHVAAPSLGPEGRIFHLWQGFGQFPPLVPNTDVSAWRGGDPPAPGCNIALRRVGLFIRFSDDCGDSWSEPSFINFAELPRADGSPYEMERLSAQGYVPRGPGLYYGTDRPEIYADLFDPAQAIYATADVALPAGRFDVILRSLDGGASWSTAYNFSDFAGGPKLLTSTPGGRLYMLRCLGRYERGKLVVLPELSWFEDRGSRLVGRAWVPFLRDGHPMTCQRADPATMNGAPGGLGDLSLSRGPSGEREDVLRVVYGSATGRGSQSLYVVSVGVPKGRGCASGDCVRRENAAFFDPPPGTTTFHAHAVDPAPGGADEQGVSLLHFLLWGAPGAPVVPSYFLLSGPGRMEGPFSLGDPWWPALGSRKFIGDYNYGSFFREPSAASVLHYLVQWPESRSGDPSPNLSLRHRFLRIKIRPPAE